jgi:hypothetical protein
MTDLPMGVWLDISEYPKDHDSGADTYWGPLALVRCLDSNVYPHGPTHFVARLEADMWLIRDGSDPVAWSELHVAPIRFMLIEGLKE